MVPYCTNVFHRIINTFSFQDAVKVKVVEKGYLLMATPIRCCSIGCYGCAGPEDTEDVVYWRKYFSHLTTYGEYFKNPDYSDQY